MKNQAWSQILVLVLAVILSLYFWLGTLALVIVCSVALLFFLLYLWRRRVPRKSEDAPQRSQRGERSTFVERSEKIVERRRAQGRRLVEVAEQIESIKPDYKRLLERLLDWYFDYLKSNETSTGDNYNVLGAKCDFLKNNIAGELDLAVLAACQLNRNGEVADSIKINRYLSVGIKWEYKSQEMIARDGMQCGNAFAKIYVNRLGQQMAEDDEMDYIDFVFDGDRMTIVEAEKHDRNVGY